MKKYRVHTDRDESLEYNTYEEAEAKFELWKDYGMSEGVVAYESFVEIVESDNDFEDYKEIKKVVAAIDHDRTELRTPREEGCDWDYWAKWVEVDLSHQCKTCDENIHLDGIGEPRLVVESSEWDHYNDRFIEIWIPINYCPECGKDARK